MVTVALKIPPKGPESDADESRPFVVEKTVSSDLSFYSGKVQVAGDEGDLEVGLKADEIDAAGEEGSEERRAHAKGSQRRVLLLRAVVEEAERERA